MSTTHSTEQWHRHDNRCYWDHTRCGWVCPPGQPGHGEITVADVLDADALDAGALDAGALDPASPEPAPARATAI